MAKRTRTAKRTLIPRRFRDIRGDSTVGAAVRTIARTLGLPQRAVCLLLPNGRRQARGDKSVASLRRDWED